jgi:beta-glucanase (GH16 family)
MPPQLHTGRATPERAPARPPRRRRLWLLAGAVVGVAVAVVVTLVVVPTPAGEPVPPVAAAPSAPPPSPDAPCGGQAPPKDDGSTWQCTYSDEFNGTELSPVWELIPYGLGSACMFNDSEYVRVADGQLQLIARRLPADHWCTEDWGLQYGGGGIQSSNGFAQQYGRLEIRAKLPEGVGFWPAIWLLPDDDSYDGEIDILEAYGGRNDNGDVTLHSPSAGPGPQASCPLLPDMTSDYHTFRMDWSPDRLSVYYDDRLCGDFGDFSGPVGDAPSVRAAFDKPYHLLLNLAVQPWWPPDETTPFPGTMMVDYVRAWQ